MIFLETVPGPFFDHISNNFETRFYILIKPPKYTLYWGPFKIVENQYLFGYFESDEEKKKNDNIA